MPLETTAATSAGNEKVHAFCPTCGTPVYLTWFSKMGSLLVS
jgi:hypothetical protein